MASRALGLCAKSLETNTKNEKKARLGYLPSNPLSGIADPFKGAKLFASLFQLETDYAKLYIGGVCTVCIDLPMSLHSWSRGEAMFLWDPEITAGSMLSYKDPQASCARYVGIRYCTK